jgi:hypothetical protein
MDRKLRVMIALALTFAIAVLFILPAFDVMPTAMRAWRAAKMLALAMATRVLLATVRPAVIVCSLADVPAPLVPSSGILDQTCSRLC